MEIRTGQLAKRYGKQVAVDGISFTARPGEILGFLGPNGAGKTTTMRMICGLTEPDGGTVHIGNSVMGPGNLQLRRAIGYLPEANPLYEDMPVPDLLRFGACIQGMAQAEAEKRIRYVVEACGLDSEKHKRIGELSRGYRQRAGLALALVNDPAVLILDEPTTGLDPNQVVDIRNLIKELSRTRTVIFSTHILPEAEAVCDRILIINHGKITADGTARELAAQDSGHALYLVKVDGAPSAEAVLAMLQELPAVASAQEAPGRQGRFEVRLTAPDGGPLFAACTARGWGISELRPVEERLEDVFRKATKP